MAPCFNVYVRVAADDRAVALSNFVDRYVDRNNPGDSRFEAFLRTYVAAEPLPGDADALADLRRDDDAGTAFSIYMRARDFDEAILTLTKEGDVVLGLGLDDPWNDPAVERRASDVLAMLMDDVRGIAGIGGVELRPPQSVAEWSEDALVTLRVESE